MLDVGFGASQVAKAPCSSVFSGQVCLLGSAGVIPPLLWPFCVCCQNLFAIGNKLFQYKFIKSFMLGCSTQGNVP